jgi:hypothetical protein
MAPRVKSYNLDAISYIPLYPPVSAYRIEVINATSVAMSLRTDPVDPTTQLTLLPGEAKVFDSAKNHQVYDPGAVLIYAILASGTGTGKVLAH